jgi:hypothetical protein
VDFIGVTVLQVVYRCEIEAVAIRDRYHVTYISGSVSGLYWVCVTGGSVSQFMYRVKLEVVVA